MFHFHPINLASPGFRTENMLYRLSTTKLHKIFSSPLFVVMIGTFNIGVHNTAEETKDGVLAIVQKILNFSSPTTRVLLCGILPRMSISLNLVVEETNRMLHEATKIMDRVHFLHVDGIFRGNPYPEHILDEDLYMPDHLHPSEKGYHLLLDLLLPSIGTIIPNSNNDEARHAFLDADVHEGKSENETALPDVEKFDIVSNSASGDEKVMESTEVGEESKIDEPVPNDVTNGRAEKAAADVAVVQSAEETMAIKPLSVPISPTISPSSMKGEEDYKLHNNVSFADKGTAVPELTRTVNIVLPQVPFSSNSSKVEAGFMNSSVPSFVPASSYVLSTTAPSSTLNDTAAIAAVVTSTLDLTKESESDIKGIKSSLNDPSTPNPFLGEEPGFEPSNEDENKEERNAKSSKGKSNQTKKDKRKKLKSSRKETSKDADGFLF